ncbi:MAG: hypothetical protein SCI25_00110 [Desulfuromonadales bacterium]|nr:hypothetical protein [Desulfuromonadales bacterium]
MTKEDWDKVEKALSGIYGMAGVKADEFEVTFHRGLVSKNRLAIVTYVDGYRKGKWVDAKDQHPEQRCLRPASRLMCKPKERAALKKMSKRLLKELGPAFDPDRKWHYYDFKWTSVAQIRRHYEKTFQSIELIEVFG